MEAAALIARIHTLGDYTPVLETGARLEKMLDGVNCQFRRPRLGDYGHQRPQNVFKDKDPDHVVTKEWRERGVQLKMQLRRSLLALYRPFALGSTNCPEQISQGYLISSVAVLLAYLEQSDRETNPGPGSDEAGDALRPYYSRFWTITPRDVIDAGLAVCWHIKTTASPEMDSRGAPCTATRSPPRGWTAANHHPRPHPPRSCNNNNSGGESSRTSISTSIGRSNHPDKDAGWQYPWPVPTLVQTVELTIDRLIRDEAVSCAGGFYLKEIVALAIVLGSVSVSGGVRQQQQPTEEQEQERLDDERVHEQEYEQRLARAEAGVRRVLEGCLQSININSSGGGSGRAFHGLPDSSPSSELPSNGPVVNSGTDRSGNDEVSAANPPFPPLSMVVPCGM
jgi:hypothetical protein